MSLEQGAKVHGPWVPRQSIYPEPIVLWHLCNKFTQVDALEKFHSCVVSTTLVLFLQHFCVGSTTLVLFLQHKCDFNFKLPVDFISGGVHGTQTDW